MKSRYLISHPTLNKESYIDTDSVRAAFFPVDGDILILNNSPDNLINYSFTSTMSLYTLPVNPYSFFLLSLIQSSDERNINTTASMFYRIHSSNYNRVIYGDALLFGSMDSLTQESDDTYYSVPYEILEQLYLLNKSFVIE